VLLPPHVDEVRHDGHQPTSDYMAPVSAERQVFRITGSPRRDREMAGVTITSDQRTPKTGGIFGVR
jgi:hypothetical protein